MKARCHGKGDNANAQVRYRDAGIVVCERWRDSFETFLADMGECPDGLSIDRIKNERGYEPENCRWATPIEQRLNSRRVHWVDIGGATICLLDALNRDRSKYRTAMKRMAAGMTAQAAYEVVIR